MHDEINISAHMKSTEDTLKLGRKHMRHLSLCLPTADTCRKKEIRSQQARAQAGVKLTILNIAVLDLLQHLGPYLRMALLVLLHTFGFQLDDLRDAASLVLLSVRRRGRRQGRGGGRRRA